MCGCSDWDWERPVWLPGAPGFTVPVPRSPATIAPTRPTGTDDDRKSSDSPSNDVRSNFPETWIWTDAMTG